MNIIDVKESLCDKSVYTLLAPSVFNPTPERLLSRAEKYQADDKSKVYAYSENGEYKSGHTRDNAFFSRNVVNDNGLKINTAMIVCKAFHARRCLMLYQLAFPDTEFIVCPVYCYNITKNNWYTTEQGINRVLGELSRCGNQFASDIKEYLL